MLAMYVDAKHKNWDAILPFMTYASNTALHEITGLARFITFSASIRHAVPLTPFFRFRSRKSHLLVRPSVTQRRQGTLRVYKLSLPKTVQRLATISDIDMLRTAKVIWCGCGLHTANVARTKSFWPATQVCLSLCCILATLRT